jgi:hypothetical protein
MARPWQSGGAGQAARSVFNRAGDILAAGAAREGASGDSARCPGQGWNGPGRKAGVFVKIPNYLPFFVEYWQNLDVISHQHHYLSTVGLIDIILYLSCHLVGYSGQIFLIGSGQIGDYTMSLCGITRDKR